MLLLRKMKSEPQRATFKNTGLVLQNEAKADLEARGAGEEVLPPRGLEYTVEECTCEDCRRSEPQVDSDHFFPLPAMEEGATILVTTKTNDYRSSLLGTECHQDGATHFYCNYLCSMV